MIKEYQYLKKHNESASILTMVPIPEAYISEFRNSETYECLSKRKDKQKKTDLSGFFPGIRISMSGSVLSNIVRVNQCLLGKKPTAVIAHQLSSALLITPYCFFFRKPFILILHDNPFLFMTQKNTKGLSLRKKFLNNLVYLVSNLTILLSRSTICTTAQIKNALKSNLAIKKTPLVADYGIDIFPETDIKERTLLLTVSKWSKFRRPRAYLDLIKFLPPGIKLTMVGRWDTEEEMNEFKEEVNNLGLADRIILKSDISEEELYDMYNKTKIFLRLGFNESGTGQAILEAIGHGCPVVISKGLGASELIKNGREGYIVDESDLQGVAECIQKMFTNDVMVSEMSAASYRLAKSHSWNDYLDKVHRALIKDIV